MAGCSGFTRALADCPLLGGDDPPADALVAGEVEGVHDGGEAAAGDRAARAGEDLSARDFVCVFRLAGYGWREESLGEKAGSVRAVHHCHAPAYHLRRVFEMARDDSRGSRDASEGAAQFAAHA